MMRPIALTSGDPAGIGPEITLKAWQSLQSNLPFFVIGDPDHYAKGAAHLGVELVLIEQAEQAVTAVEIGLPILPIPFASPNIAGTPDHKNAPGVIHSIEHAVELTLKGRCSAVCTNPISKQVLIEGGDFKHPGHTEFLADLCGVKRSVMMLTSHELSVVPVTIHIALSEVPSALTPELLKETVEITHAALQRDFGIPAPRIAVSGLNPHAGEGGIMGHEDQTVIMPMLEQLNRQGMTLKGPLPADTMFHKSARQTYDAAICMYHDQALIPIKTLSFDTGVNTTLGLPIIRTSPDHGTAFNIAGKGLANPTSLIEALKCANDMAQNRSRHDAYNA